jgi:predicted DNA-binding transcriptional regulator AlpA
MTNQPRVVAQAEVTQMLKVSRKRVSELTSSEGFPTPLGTLTVGRVWSYDDVKDWAERTGRTVHPIGAES